MTIRIATPPLFFLGAGQTRVGPCSAHVYGFFSLWQRLQRATSNITEERATASEFTAVLKKIAHPREWLAGFGGVPYLAL
jgi:hypothetical protein